MTDQDADSQSDISKEDLLRLLACLQSELEARDLVINTLKTGCLGCSNIQPSRAKIHKDGTSTSEDPFFALQRDSLVSSEVNVEERSLKAIYDVQFTQLENLIETQRLAQEKLREQLQHIEEKYLKARAALEEQRKSHERVTAQGDDVLILLEKERERLRSEIELEKIQNQKLEKDLKRVLFSWRQQKLLLTKQRQVAVVIIKEHRRLLSQSSRYQRRIHELEAMLACNPDVASSNKLPACASDTIRTSAAPEISLEEYSRIKEQLSAETTARMELQRSFDKLQRDYEKLVSITSSTSITKAESPTGSLTAVVGHLGDTPSSQSLRSKPTPPLRRTSEVFPLEVSSSSLATNGPTERISPCHSTTSSPPMRSDPSMTTLSSCPQSTALSLSPLTVTLSSQTTSSLLSESRSSTPSPPPPPPPVQLHYPYPSIQSHVNQSQSRTTTGAAQFLSSASGRPLSVPPSQSPVRGILVTQATQQLATSYQHFYHSSSTHPINRTHSASSTVGCVFVPKKTAVSTPSVHHSHTSVHSSNYQHPYSTPYMQSHTKHTSTGSSTFVQRGNTRPAIGQHVSATHHFPYSPTRVHPAAGSVRSNMRMARASPAVSSSAGLSGANTSIGTGHLCINGK